MRPSCLYCARKHLAQASILAAEAQMGYPDHVWLAIGHMAEASEELIDTYPDMAKDIRAYRKSMETGGKVPFMPLIAAVGKLGAQRHNMEPPTGHQHLDSPPPTGSIKTDAAIAKLAPEVHGPGYMDGVADMWSEDHVKRVEEFYGRKDIERQNVDLREFPAAPIHGSGPGTIEGDARIKRMVSAFYGDESTRIGKYTASENASDEELAEVSRKNDELKHTGRYREPSPEMKEAYGIPAAAAPPINANDPRALAYSMGYPVHAENALPPTTAPCLTCGDKHQLVGLAAQLAAETPKPRLVILTTLFDFNPSYSLTSVVLEQAHAAVLVGYRVIILIHRGANVSQLPPLPPEISVLSIVPTAVWREDVIDEPAVDVFVQAMYEWVQVLLPPAQNNQQDRASWLKNMSAEEHASAVRAGVADPFLHIITLDLLFQSWFVTFAKAIHLFAGTPGYLHRIKWYHTAHSSVGARPPVEHPNTPIGSVRSATFSAEDEMMARARYYRCTLPPGHKLLALNYSDVPHLQKYYATTEPGQIVTLLNSKDVRPFLRMSQTASLLATRYQLHLADVTMIYPMSLERAREKGVDKVLHLLGALKHLGLTVRLLLATANARPSKVITPLIAWIKEVAIMSGLTVATEGELFQEVVLTCEALPDTAGSGLVADDVRSLWLVSNLFVFPTVSEAGSLVLMEAALAGTTLVLNKSLPCLADYIPAELAMWVPWGSLKEPGQPPTGAALNDLAMAVWDHMRDDRGSMLRRHIMTTNGLEAHGMALKAILESPGPELSFAESFHLRNPGMKLL